MKVTKHSALVGLALAGLVIASVCIWLFWKPIRVLAPTFAGVECYAGDTCIDDPARLDEARLMRAQALVHVEGVGGKLQSFPRGIFCTTAACDERFGFKGNVAYNVGAIGFVISSNGWHSHVVRHELLHCLQVERIGDWRMLFISPQWLVEGMAYSASEDPRRPLTEPWEEHRSKYEAWANGVQPHLLWEKAAALKR